MAIVYVIHSDADRAFVEEELIRALPSLGFDRWLSRTMTPSSADADRFVRTGIERSAAVLVVVPSSGSLGAELQEDVRIALDCRSTVIPVYRGRPAAATADPVIASLGKAGGVDAREEASGELWRSLADLLPPPADGEQPLDAETIEWNEEVFSGLLAEAVARHDFNRGESLTLAFSRHIGQRPYPYPPDAAKRDLKALRRKRQFLLMKRYAKEALQSGTDDFQVRRQYAQALIELKELNAAEAVLVPLIKDATAANDAERFEARGLMGRLLKQLYVDADTSRPDLLRNAIETYGSAFREDNDNVWHGINTASCILRATRDRVDAPTPSDAREIAETILILLARRQARTEAAGKLLDVWDYATRVEALVDLDDFRKAAHALDEYLGHPGIDAFEVSSTFRQFDEVLQLGGDDRGAPLLNRLARAAERLRSGGLASIDKKGPRPMLVRVSDPGWTGEGIPDLVIHTQLGTILSVTGSELTVKALLKDPLVIGIEESRQSGQTECDRSLPFVNCTETFEGPGGAYSEKGGGAIVAVIDDGIDLLHHAFLDANGQSRVIGIWDQQDNDAPCPPPGFDFGRYHSRADIARYVAGKDVPASLLQMSQGHGTHVASIAAGRHAGAFAGGVAPEAQILFVISGGAEPTGYSHAHLAALKFIDQKANELGMPVVVNVSQGMNAGAHDGQSALEVAFDEFAKGGRAPGRVVVKSAGNERDKRGHAKLSVPSGGADELVWRCQPGPARVRLELWWHSANQYRFRLESPSDDLSDWVERKNPDVDGYFKKRGPYEMKLVTLHPDNGDNLLKIEVDNGISPIAPSDWTLTVEAVDVRVKADIHAWLERAVQGQAPTEFVRHDSEEMTLSIPGTSHSVITVSAIDADRPIKVGGFSSFGPTRDGREKPDIAAPGVNVKAAKQGSADDVIALDGTSMAAPHVTGAIALLLSKAAREDLPVPTATQVGAVLRQKTMNFSGQWNPGQGYGVLDVAALLAAF